LIWIIRALQKMCTVPMGLLGGCLLVQESDNAQICLDWRDCYRRDRPFGLAIFSQVVGGKAFTLT